MNNSSWDYHCDSNYGCDQYTKFMISIKPCKNYIQHFCSIIVDVINYICQDSDTEIMQKKIDANSQALKEQKQLIQSLMPPPDIYLNVDEWLTDEPDHWDMIPKNRLHMD